VDECKPLMGGDRPTGYANGPGAEEETESFYTTVEGLQLRWMQQLTKMAETTLHMSSGRSVLVRPGRNRSKHLSPHCKPSCRESNLLVPTPST
jgi:hypothetical protein